MVLQIVHLLLLRDHKLELHHLILLLQCIDLVSRLLPLNIIVVIRNGQSLTWESWAVDSLKVHLRSLAELASGKVGCVAIHSAVARNDGVDIHIKVGKLLTFKMEPFVNWI